MVSSDDTELGKGRGWGWRSKFLVAGYAYTLPFTTCGRQRLRRMLQGFKMGKRRDCRESQERPDRGISYVSSRRLMLQSVGSSCSVKFDSFTGESLFGNFIPSSSPLLPNRLSMYARGLFWLMAA